MDKVLEWIKELWPLIISWPIIVLVIVLILTLNRNASRRISVIFRGFKSVKMFGAEFEFTEVGKQEVTQSFRGVFGAYRNQASDEYDRLVGANSIREKLEQVVSSVVLKRNGKSLKKLKDIRCTIHVPDVIFAETMYQLLDYYPKGGGRGRTWSIRYGIIGKAWRLGESMTQEEIQEGDTNELIKDWGMTREEATASGYDRQSFSCVILCNEGKNAIGIFYIDAKDKNAFGGMSESEKAQFHKDIHSACESSKLILSLDSIRKELLTKAPIIKVYG